MNTESRNLTLKLNSFQTERFIIVIKTPHSRNKVMQIRFSKNDGTLFVDFPYYKFKQGLVSLVTFPGNVSLPTNLELKPGGKVASHLVKYSHHPDGRAHFSQDGRVKSNIKKISIPLAEAEGHLFTAQIQGMSDYELADPNKDSGYSLKRTAFEFNFENAEPETIKIVGRWYSLSNLLTKFEGQFQENVGPIVPCLTDSGKQYLGVLVLNPHLDSINKYLLLITCEAVTIVDKESHSALTFIGGFDSPDIVNNTKVDTNFLALSYPVRSFKDLKKEIGSIDFVRNK